MTANYEIGSVIEYRAGGDIRRVQVEDKDPDIKNGRPGFDGFIVESMNPRRLGAGVWGYDSQITRVIR